MQSPKNFYPPESFSGSPSEGQKLSVMTTARATATAKTTAKAGRHTLQVLTSGCRLLQMLPRVDADQGEMQRWK
jgi:hypothetical protein